MLDHRSCSDPVYCHDGDQHLHFWNLSIQTREKEARDLVPTGTTVIQQGGNRSCILGNPGLKTHRKRRFATLPAITWRLILSAQGYAFVDKLPLFIVAWTWFAQLLASQAARLTLVALQFVVSHTMGTFFISQSNLP